MVVMELLSSGNAVVVLLWCSMPQILSRWEGLVPPLGVRELTMRWCDSLSHSLRPFPNMCHLLLLLFFWASPTVVLDVVVVVEPALLAVPFLVPVTNSIFVPSFLAFFNLSISVF